MSNTSKVLLVYTGGTIGMIQDPETGSLKAFDFNSMSQQIPELKQLPVELSCESFEEPIDSSEMLPVHWKRIAKTIFENYSKYDGFVVLHGSDTMAYSASAVSFMLQGLTKPVIFTGSQLPIGTLRTDGKENLITAIQIAGEKDDRGKSRIQEVAIYFEYSLYRGNRTSKVSANNFEAFSSPNLAELAIAGVHIRYNQLLTNYTEGNKLSLHTDWEERVALVKLFPGFNPEVYASLFNVENTKGIVLETYGAGNGPSTKAFQEILENYISSGGIVLNITQCSSGSVEQGKYETSSFFSEVGVISGLDMTTETAIAKLMYVLSNEKWNKKELLEESLVGEMTL